MGFLNSELGLCVTLSLSRLFPTLVLRLPPRLVSSDVSSDEHELTRLDQIIKDAKEGVHDSAQLVIVSYDLATRMAEKSLLWKGQVIYCTYESLCPQSAKGRTNEWGCSVRLG